MENCKIFHINKKAKNEPLDSFIPQDILNMVDVNDQKTIPKLAKDPLMISQIEEAVEKTPSNHTFCNLDSRNMSNVPDNSVHLVVTSPPYWTLKKYPDSELQLGGIKDYEAFLNELDAVWKHIYRVLVPGGRLVIVVGDVCLSRKEAGRHVVFPLHASIQEHCRKIGFDNLAPIIWYKISNAKFEAKRATSFLGKPYEPNGIVKNDIEYILFQRKPGGYRSPNIGMKLLSIIPEDKHKMWFQQIWDIKGASTKLHPAPYPLELAERIIKMFSFVGDTVLDPFTGTGTSAVAAAKCGRNSISFEVETMYYQMAINRFEKCYQEKLQLKLNGEYFE